LYNNVFVIDYARHDGKTECTPCSPGRYADKEGFRKCAQCHAGENKYA